MKTETLEFHIKIFNRLAKFPRCKRWSCPTAAGASPPFNPAAQVKGLQWAAADS